MNLKILVASLGIVLPVLFIHGAKFDIYVKSFKYWVHPEYGKIDPKQCKLKVTREKPTGLGTCGGYLLKQIDYAYAQVKLYYRYGTIWREYIVNYKDVKVCEFVKKQRTGAYLTNPVANLVVKGLKYCCHCFNHECPYFPGWYNATEVDINATISPLLPPVIPAGTYKIWGRGYLDNNFTISSGEGTAVVKARQEFATTDFNMLNMG